MTEIVITVTHGEMVFIELSLFCLLMGGEKGNYLFNMFIMEYYIAYVTG